MSTKTSHDFWVLLERPFFHFSGRFESIKKLLFFTQPSVKEYTTLMTVFSRFRHISKYVINLAREAANYDYCDGWSERFVEKEEGLQKFVPNKPGRKLVREGKIFVGKQKKVLSLFNDCFLISNIKDTKQNVNLNKPKDFVIHEIELIGFFNEARIRVIDNKNFEVTCQVDGDFFFFIFNCFFFIFFYKEIQIRS